MKKLKPIPKFNTEDEEREFWATHNSTDYIDWSKSKRVRFSNLKPSTQSITVRLPKSMVDSLKMFANEQDIPYQSLLKTYLHEKIQDAFYRKKNL